MRSRFSRRARETAMSTALGGLGSCGMRVVAGFRVKSPVLSFWKLGAWESTTGAYCCAQKYSCKLLVVSCGGGALLGTQIQGAAISPDTATLTVLPDSRKRHTATPRF